LTLISVSNIVCFRFNIVGSESLASMSHVAIKAPAVPGMKKRKASDVRYGERLVDSPSGTVAKKKVARTDGISVVSAPSSTANATEAIDNHQLGGSDDFGNEDDGDVTMGGVGETTEATTTTTTSSSTSTKESAESVPLPPQEQEKNSKRSRFIEAQRKRIEEKKRVVAEQKAAQQARVQAAQDATARAVAVQNANVHTERGKGGWWDQEDGVRILFFRPILFKLFDH
jgi:hypothetical protein